jgi:tRNA(adenine34) deaminase
LYDLSNDQRLNHRIEVKNGVLEKDCGELLSKFFRKLRKRS